MSTEEDRPRTKVSRQEELLYGPYAGMVRRLGRAAEEAEAAWREAETLLAKSMEGDAITATVIREPGEPSPLDDEGRTAHTRWCRAAEAQTNDVRTGMAQLLSQLATEAATWEARTRGVELAPIELRLPAG